ncbi:hypothetical protein TcG_02911 [Trypanosoma cruzi]|nr:hypothetical protein TcG_02911 [Trypanosoma cruzi]
MEKRSSALNQGSCPSAVSPFTLLRPATTPGSALWCTFPNIEQYSGKFERVDLLRQLRDHVWIQIVCLHDWSSVPQRALFYGMRRGIPRSQSSFDMGGRNIRELFVVSKCHTELYSVEGVLPSHPHEPQGAVGIRPRRLRRHGPIQN